MGHTCRKSKLLSALIACVNTVSEPLELQVTESVLSEKQTPQVIVFSRKLSEKGERLERACVRPRQVRYQAALRPDSNCCTDSKLLPKTSPPMEGFALFRYWCKPCQNCATTNQFIRNGLALKAGRRNGW
jgi:hypothetical protein